MPSNQRLIILISSISTLLPFIVYIALWQRVPKRKHLIALWLFFAVNVATEIVVYAYSLLGKPNAWIVHIYTPIEFGLSAYIISCWRQRSLVSRTIRRSIPVYFCSYFILKVTGLESFEAETINYLSRPVSLLFLSGFGFNALHEVWISSTQNVLKNYRFWIFLSIAGYSSGSILVDAFLYIRIDEILWHLLEVHVLLNILRNLLFMTGIILAIRPISTEHTL